MIAKTPSVTIYTVPALESLLAKYSRIVRPRSQKSTVNCAAGNTPCTTHAKAFSQILHDCFP